MHDILLWRRVRFCRTEMVYLRFCFLVISGFGLRRFYHD